MRTFLLSGGWAMCVMDLLEPEDLSMVIEGLTGFLDRIPPVLSSLYPSR